MSNAKNIHQHDNREELLQEKISKVIMTIITEGPILQEQLLKKANLSKNQLLMVENHLGSWLCKFPDRDWRRPLYCSKEQVDNGKCRNCKYSKVCWDFQKIRDDNYQYEYKTIYFESYVLGFLHHNACNPPEIKAYYLNGKRIEIAGDVRHVET
ncbi:MAG: hypothetical protein HWN67_04955 [Candidatus Helarchaeota archaeon]|nr:hypothetical protein [Candidatus Helarchaeota archaeon]